jgi:hypothetical protein
MEKDGAAASQRSTIALRVTQRWSRLLYCLMNAAGHSDDEINREILRTHGLVAVEHSI